MSRGLKQFYSNYVYRVLRPDEDPNNDLTCVNSYSSCTIDEHVESGLRTPTRFISTTTRLDKAVKWMETADNITYQKYKNKRSVIVKIDIELIKQKYPNVANSAYDLTNSNNLDYFLKNDKQKNFACAYSEIVFERYIPSEAVSVCYTKKDGHVNRPNIPTINLNPILLPETEPRNYPGYADEIGYGKPNTIPLSSETNRPREMIGLSPTNFETLGSTRPSQRPNRITPGGDHQNLSQCETILSCLFCICCCVVVVLMCLR